MTKKLMFVLFISVLSLGAYAHDITGSELASRGDIITLEGTLKVVDSECYLVSGSGEYLLHLGPEWYSEEIGFQEEDGQVVSVTGYVLGNDIAPVKISYGGKTFEFRNQDGIPLWSGRGRRQNAWQADKNHGRRF